MIPLKKILFSLLLIILIVALPLVNGCQVVTGSGEIITLVMDYQDFTRIDIGYGFEVEVTRADVYLVSVTIDEVLVEYLNIDQSGDKIHIGLKSNYRYANLTRKVVINLPDLRTLELSGGSEGTVSGFSVSHNVDFELSGASRINIIDLEAEDVDLNISGASDVTGSIDMDDGDFDLSGGSRLELTGSAKDISVEASGASDVGLEDFPVDNADIELSGASDAEIYVSGQLKIDLSGASELIYAGHPLLGSIDVSGGSSITQK